MIRKASLSNFKSNADNLLAVRVWRLMGGQKRTLVSKTGMVPFRRVVAHSSMEGREDMKWEDLCGPAECSST